MREILGKPLAPTITKTAQTNLFSDSLTQPNTDTSSEWRLIETTVMDYWSLCPISAIGRRHNIKDLGILDPIRPDLLWLKVIWPDGDGNDILDFVYKAVGKNVSKGNERAFAGDSICDAVQQKIKTFGVPGHQGEILGSLMVGLKTQKPVFYTGHMMNGNRTLCAVTMLLLPLCNEHLRVTDFIGAAIIRPKKPS